MIRYLYLLLAAILWNTAPLYSQEQKPMLRVADDRFMRNEYAAAIPLYKDVVRKKPAITTLRKLAYCYQFTNDYPNAVLIWEQVTKLAQADKEDWLEYGDMLRCNARYDDAKKAYVQLGDSAAGKIAERIAGCDSAVAWQQAPAAYELTNVSEANTALSDWGGVEYPGKEMVFASTFQRYQQLDPKAKTVAYLDKRTMMPFLKIYTLDSGATHTLYGLAPAFNQFKFHTGPVTFSPGFQTAYFTVTDIDKIHYEKTPGKRKMKLGERRLELYVSKRENDQWKPAEAFAYNKPDSFSVGHAALSKDGQILYFTSDMPGGYGNRDIWYCELQGDGSWGMPHNCGPVINTDEQDDFPTINDGVGLYFSSKGHLNMGGMDIFYAVGSKNNWAPPQNMKSPVNSAGDDFYFVAQEEGRGMLSSNRPGGKGNDDIYRYLSATPHIVIAGLVPLILQTTVLDEQRSILPGALVTVTETGRDISWSHLTDAAGHTHQAIDPSGSYIATATLEGYHGATEKVDMSTSHQSDTVKVVLVLQQRPPENELKKGSTFVLKNIFYDFDKWNIRADASTDLDSLVAILKSHPTMKIELSSHTDCRGTAAYNMLLSQRRAESAVNYLVTRGISRARMIAKGYGESRLVNDCDCTKGHECSSAQHQENRRTEITILEE